MRAKGNNYVPDFSDNVTAIFHATDASETDGGIREIEGIKSELKPLLMKRIGKKYF